MIRRRAWYAWTAAVVTSFAYLEWSAYSSHTSPTLSRELQKWTASKRCPWSPLIFLLAGGWLSWHIRTLRDLPTSDG